MFHLRAEEPADVPAIEALLDRSFGPDRHLKTSYAFRRGVPPAAAFSRVAEADGRLVGTIRYWPLDVGGAPAFLLGPLGVEPALRGRGIGRALLRDSLARLRAEAPILPVLLVGDPGYYRPLGFDVAPATTVMPGEDPARLMVDGAGPRPAAGVVRPASAAAVGPAGMGLVAAD